MVTVGEVSTLQQIRNPADAAFGKRHAQVREFLPHRRPDPVCGGVGDGNRHGGDPSVDRRQIRSVLSFHAGTDMAADHHLVIAAGFPQRVPVIAMDRRVAMNSRVVRQRKRVHTLSGQTFDFGSRGFHVPPRHDHQRNETAWRSVAPIVQMPVVVGLDGRHRHVSVSVYLETLSGKTRKGGEAQ